MPSKKLLRPRELISATVLFSILLPHVPVFAASERVGAVSLAEDGESGAGIVVVCAAHFSTNDARRHHVAFEDATMTQRT